MSNLKLFIGNKNYSTWSMRAWLALKHTGIDFEEIKFNLYTPSSKVELTTHTPAGLVPALQHNDISVWDSLAIIDYCARIAPDKLWWPEENAAYALARSMTAEMHSGFMALRTHASMNIRRKWQNLSLSDAVERDIRRIEALWDQAQIERGDKGPFLFGTFSAADMMFAPVVMRFNTYGFNINDNAKRYVSAMLDHTYMKEWITDALTETAEIEAAEYPDDLSHIG
ncbi:glutathione S-transferase family protein [Kordiimonas aquimaris]|uniref:glutathione S-transferase family protein n=1 Tax=Kordiimonas aquimaris TaxID=707591 RepID=UPI0021D099FA|nr:glutathione S-transferase family protein [Kordiimonas aquimaris]